VVDQRPQHAVLDPQQAAGFVAQQPRGVIALVGADPGEGHHAQPRLLRELIAGGADLVLHQEPARGEPHREEVRSAPRKFRRIRGIEGREAGAFPQM
jgi:hypothetical protein